MYYSAKPDVALADNGGTRILYHAVDVNNSKAKPVDEVNTRRIMLIDRLEWKDGWPQVEPSN